MNANALPPWHTWGADREISVPVVLANNFSQEFQVAKVSYGRPDSWRVWFFAEPRYNSLTNNQLTNLILGVRFQLAFGIGRTVFDSANSSDRVTVAQQMVWQVASLSTAVIRQKWTNKFFIPDLDDRSSPAVNDSGEVFVAQNIQASASVFCDAGFAEIPLNTLAQFRCGVFLAPNVHVRPEWAVGEFKGGEDGDHL